MKRIAVFFTVVLMISSIEIVSGTEYVWNGTSGNWETSGNWTQTGVPGINDIVTFPSGTYTVTISANTSVGGIKLSTGANVSFSGGYILTLKNAIADSTDLDIPSGASLTLTSGFQLRYLENGITATVAGTLTVDAGATLSLNETGYSSTTQVTGTIINKGSILGNTGRLSFMANSNYQHSQNGGSIPAATWNLTSTCRVIGCIASPVTQNTLNQTFGNFIWDCPGQTGSFNLNAKLSNVAGTFTVANTGSSGSINLEGDATFGNLLITGGILRFSGTTYASSVSVTVPGNLTISGGTLNICNNAYTGTLNLSGNFSHSSGTLSETQSGTGVVVFKGTGTQIYSSGGSTSGTINFTVNNGATLQMGTGDTPAYLTGPDATFTLSSGATLGITGENGIALTGATGNIRVAGTRTYDAGANYIYMRNGNQVTGQGLPTTITGNLTVSGSSVLTPSANITANGNITINSGATLIKGSAALTANGQLVVNGTLQPEAASVVGGTGTLSGSGTVKVTRTETTADFLSQYTITNKSLSGLTVDYANPTGGQKVSAITYDNLTLSNTSGTNTIAGSVTVDGTLTNSTGTLDIGINSLDVNALVNNGLITINSTDVAVNGSLIAASSSGDGFVTYNRQLRTEANDGDFHYVAPPVSGNTVSNSEKVDSVYTWNEVDALWESTTMTSLESGRSYNLRQTGTSDGLITFTGTLVTGNVAIDATSPFADIFTGSTPSEYLARAYIDGSAHSYHPRSPSNPGGLGWNLLGNPYTSAIDAEEFVSHNTSMFDPNYKAVYIYDGTVGEKGVYKYIAPSVPGQTFGGTFGNSDIQVGQGFFVLAMNDYSTFTFTHAMQQDNTVVPMTKKSSVSEPWPAIVLKANYGSGESTTTLVYNNDMTLGLDPGYDVGLYSAWPAVEVYTLLPKTENSIAFTRQALPMTYYDEVVVPVGIATAEGGTVTFSADVIPISGYKFWLEDREKGIFTDLNTSSYTAQIAAQTYGPGRFYLKVSDLALSAENDLPGNNLNVRIWISGNQINIEGLVSDKATASVIDLMGRKLTDNRLSGSDYNSISVPSSIKGLHVIRVTDGIKVHTQKVIF